MLELIQLTLPTDFDGPDAELHRGALAVNKASQIAGVGHADFAMQRHDLAYRLTPRPDFSSYVIVAVEDARVVGFAEGEASMNDNLTQCELQVTVHPDHRRRGIGTAMLADVQRWAHSLERTVHITWTLVRPLAEGEATVVAPTGDHYPADDPGWQFASQAGFTLEQVERFSVVHLPIPNKAELHADALAHADGYRLHNWADAIPEDWLDGYAALRARVSIDVPNAGIETEEEVWDAARVQRSWDLIQSLGYNRLTVAAEHETSGQLVGFTQISWHTGNPSRTYQGYTFVRSDHRGHRLGMLIKMSALDVLATANPAANRIETDNAGENDHMLAINNAMGYKLAGLIAYMQKKFD